MSKLKPGEFSKRVCELALQIPKGKVTTYGLLAVAAGGHPILAQMITNILGKSKEALKIPFHRIVYSSGKIWTNPKYDKVRRELYKKEGIKIDKKNRIVDFEKHIYDFGDIKEKKYFVYMLKCNDKTLYTGITTNLERRLKEHNDSKLGAKYTKLRRPVELIYSKEYANRSLATIEEARIKKLPRKEKLDFIGI